MKERPINASVDRNMTAVTAYKLVNYDVIFNDLDDLQNTSPSHEW